MGLKGKGFFIWKIAECEGGDPKKIAQVAQQAGLTHILIKIANGIYAYNYDWDRLIDLCPPVVAALKERGIQVWGWHYVYGASPAQEAAIAIRRVKELELDGYVIDAEHHYKAQANNKAAAKTFMRDLRAGLGANIPVALSSYRFPAYHRELPWNEFLEKCDINMPQVYWMQAHNAGQQVTACLRAFETASFIQHQRPIIPTGAAFTEHGWTPTASDVLEFLETTRQLNLPAANFWEWSSARNVIDINIWNTIKEFAWDSEGPSPLPDDITKRYIDALNSGDVERVVSLYTPSAVHVTSSRTVNGATAIRSWYNTMLNRLFPSGIFSLTGYSGSGASRHFTWTVISPQGRVLNGNDTLGLVGDRIVYHFSLFTIN
ncbi:MAG: nuclear transport factor 2 family protein [Anaerolineales bacterium]|nr:nuclear transport factor 2 family protein [Anaerolineales bacterium]